MTGRDAACATPPPPPGDVAEAGAPAPVAALENGTSPGAEERETVNKKEEALHPQPLDPAPPSVVQERETVNKTEDIPHPLPLFPEMREAADLGVIHPLPFPPVKHEEEDQGVLHPVPFSSETEADAEPLPEEEDEVEAILTDFRDWLRSQGPEPARELANGEAPPTIDLHTVLGHFVALRQEVNLQTRSVRAQQEQNAEVLQQMQQALASLRQKDARNEQLAQQAQEGLLRPLLKTLVDLYDSLALAGREIQRTREGVEPLLAALAADVAAENSLPDAADFGPGSSRPFWSRWLLSPTADAALRSSQEETQRAVERLQQERMERRARLLLASESGQRVHQMLDALVTGYTMSLQRVERALRQHGLTVIPTQAEPFDPDRMEALEAVRDSGLPSGAVVEEVRRGYLWNERVFRFAQVRVARD